MSSGVATYGSQVWNEAIFGVSDIPTSYYVALVNDQPGPDMDGDLIADTEPTDAAYRRVLYQTGPEFWGTNGNFVTNLQDITFPVPSQDWGYLSYFVLCTDITSGDIYAWGEFNNPQYAQANYQLVLPAGSIVITLSDQDNSIAV